MNELRETAQAALEHWDKVSGIFRMTTETNRLRAALAQPETAEPQEGSKPHAYLMEKLAMVMPLFQEARDALTAITEQQRIARSISPTLADRMDVAGTYSVDDWYRNHALNKLPSHRCSSLCSPDETFCAITKDGKCDAMDRSCDAVS